MRQATNEVAIPKLRTRGTITFGFSEEAMGTWIPKPKQVALRHLFWGRLFCLSLDHRWVRVESSTKEKQKRWANKHD